MPLCAAIDETPRAAYVHVPFCAHRCGYCNFTLIAGRDDLAASYLEALAIELQSLQTPHEVETLFFGGGTPTHLAGDQLDELFSLVARWLPLAEQGELSVEANPLDLTEERAAILKRAGVTRVSLGVQSFHSQKLSVLERDHRAENVRDAFRRAAEIADSVSIDLIFAAPGETLEMWQDDLSAALELQPQHLSTYGLTFERGTAFWSRLAKSEIARADEDLERALYLEAIDRLTTAGMEHYEVSNFALPGERCRHNETYWLGYPYFAFGPGAARYIGGIRETNHRSTTTYIQRVLSGKSPVAESEQLDSQERARELLVFALRRLEGINCHEFLAATGHEVEMLIGKSLKKFLALGLLMHQGSQLQLTRAGLLVSDAIWPEFLHAS